MEPQTYSAVMEAEKASEEAKSAKKPIEQRVTIQADPLTSFEGFHVEVKTELTAWMTWGKEARLAKAEKYAAPLTKHSEETFKLTPVRRHKILNYIMWIESVHPHGDREVAAIAFNGLFPKKLKSKE